MHFGSGGGYQQRWLIADANGVHLCNQLARSSIAVLHYRWYFSRNDRFGFTGLANLSLVAPQRNSSCLSSFHPHVRFISIVEAVPV